MKIETADTTKGWVPEHCFECQEYTEVFMAFREDLGPFYVCPSCLMKAARMMAEEGYGTIEPDL